MLGSIRTETWAVHVRLRQQSRSYTRHATRADMSVPTVINIIPLGRQRAGGGWEQLTVLASAWRETASPNLLRQTSKSCRRSMASGRRLKERLDMACRKGMDDWIGLIDCSRLFRPSGTCQSRVRLVKLLYRTSVPEKDQVDRLLSSCTYKSMYQKETTDRPISLSLFREILKV